MASSEQQALRPLPPDGGRPLQKEHLPLAFPFRTISRPEDFTPRRTQDLFPGVTDPPRGFRRVPRAQKRKAPQHRPRDDDPLERFPSHPASCEIRGRALKDQYGTEAARNQPKSTDKLRFQRDPFIIIHRGSEGWGVPRFQTSHNKNATARPAASPYLSIVHAWEKTSRLRSEGARRRRRRCCSSFNTKCCKNVPHFSVEDEFPYVLCGDLGPDGRLAGTIVRPPTNSQNPRRSSARKAAGRPRGYRPASGAPPPPRPLP